MSKKYKIKQGDAHGGSDASDLVGCGVRETDDGKHYEFLAILAKSTGNSLPTLPYTFPSFSFEGQEWSITLSTVTATEATGSWSNGDSRITGDQTGTWTAQVDQGADEEDAAAASA